MGPMSRQDESQALARVPESVGPEAFKVDANGVPDPKLVDFGDEKLGTADELKQKVHCYVLRIDLITLGTT